MKKIIYSILVGATALTAHAADFGQIAREYALTNPAVTAERARCEALVAEKRAENVLAGPEAEFSYKWPSRRGEDQRWDISVGQEFEWPGIYGIRAQQADRMAQWSSNLHSQTLIDKTLEIEQAMIALAQANANAELCREIAANFDRLAAIYNKSLQRGETTILEVRKIEIRSFEVQRQLAEAQSAVTVATEKLKSLCGGTLPAADFNAIPRPALLSMADYEAAPRPALLAADFQMEAASAGAKVASRSALPSFTVSYNHTYEEGIHFNGFGVGITLPSWNNKRRTAKAAAELEEARANRNDVALTENQQLSADYAEATSLLKAIQKAGAAFEKDEFVPLLDKALSVGRLTLSEYLLEYETYISAKQGYVDVCAAYADAEARLSRYLQQ